MAKNPADMTDEELDEAIKNPPEDGLIPPVEIVVPSKEEKKPKEERPEDKKPDVKVEPPKEDEPTVEPEKEEVEEEEKPISARETKRVSQLLAKMKEMQAAPPASAAPTVPSAMDYSKTIEAEQEVLDKLEADRKAVSDAAYQAGLAQTNSIMFHTRLEMDAPKMEAKYPQLDKDSDKFNERVANDVNTMYLHYAGYDNKTDRASNPNLRYSDFVESIFGLADDIGTEKVAKSEKEIAKQASNTALRPDGSTVKRLNLNKLPEQMTDEELDARIALAIPSK